jgi:alpha-L-rhamnosidase
VYDLGQNISGIFRLHVHEEKGTHIRLFAGEVLQNGNFYNENLRTALAEYHYVSDGMEKDIVPSFTFYGYRYMKVEGITEPKLSDFEGLALYSDLKETGKLTTGHNKVNRLIKNVEYGQKDNFVDVPTDCPQRDERLGWTGDAQVFSATSCFLRDSYAFYRKYLYDMKTEQDENGGMVPDIIPSLDKPYRSCSSVWGDASCIIPWNVYQFYGDRSILEECFDGMKAWVDYIQNIDKDSHLWKDHFHYGDWLALDHPTHKEDVCMGGTYEGYIAEVYYYNSASIVRKAAEILGREEDAKHYRKLEEWLLSELRAEYFTEKGRCAVDTQTGILLGLQYDLIPEKSNMQTCLLQKLNQNENKLQTGFVGTPFLLGQLTETGNEHLAYDLLLNEDYPGWLYEVNLGATTIWERWNSLNPDGSVSSTGMNSLNHYAYGSVLEWICRYAAGLNQAEDGIGFQKALIRPYPDVRLEH